MLGGELKKAKASGKSRVTAASMRGPIMSRQKLETIRSAAVELVEFVPKGSLDDADQFFSLPTSLLLKLQSAINAAN